MQNTNPSEGILYLVQVPYFEDYGPMRRAAGKYFPLGLGYIAASAKMAGYEVRFFDPNVQDITPDQIAQQVDRNKPTLVGLSFMTPQFFSARKWSQAIKAVSPETPLVLGGAHSSVMPSETLNEIPEADFVVIGEGEATTVELLEALVQKQTDLSHIPGLAWRDQGLIRLNSFREPIEDLDSMPFPARSIIDQTLYRAQSFLSYSRKAATIYTSRGCPGRCVFCCSGHALRSRVRERSIQNVMEEIALLRSEYRVDYLLIKDDTFTMRKSRVSEFCRALASEHPGLRWHCMGRVNTVDYDLLAEMKASGLNDIFFGIESGNDEILKRSHKGITTSQVRLAVDSCAKLGIRTYGAFIVGLPGETPETARQTIEFAKSLPLTMAGFSILIPYPGTRVFAEHMQFHPEEPIDYGQFVASTGMHYVKGYTGLNGLDVSDLPALVSRAQKQFYFRPNQIIRMLSHASPSMLLGYLMGFTALMSKAYYLAGRKALNKV